MSGWFAVKRGITSHALFKGKPDRLAVWLWLLDNAVWKDTTHDVKGHTVKVPRGSVCASERHISEQCGVGYQVVRTAIKRFKSEHMINAQPTHGKNLITLCNYEKYQDPKGDTNAQTNATLTQPQRNPNAQKEQGNKVTTEESTNVLLQSQPIPVDDTAMAFSAYNSIAERVGWPVIQKVTPARRSAVKARIKDCGGYEAWHEAMQRAEKSPFLSGQKTGTTPASFDWLNAPKNFTKLMEGNYDERTTPNGNGHRGNGGAIPHRRQNGADPALEQIARLAGLGAPSGQGGV